VAKQGVCTCTIRATRPYAQLRGHSPNGEIRLQFSQTTVTLDAGQRHQVNVTPHARQRPLTGNEQLHRFDVHVHSQDEAHFLVVETGKAIVKPLLPAWALISVTGIAISVVLILLLGLAGILAPAPEPNVANFAVTRHKSRRVIASPSHGM
jgi:hypothetical protein